MLAVSSYADLRRAKDVTMTFVPVDGIRVFQVICGSPCPHRPAIRVWMYDSIGLADQIEIASDNRLSARHPGCHRQCDGIVAGSPIIAVSTLGQAARLLFEPTDSYRSRITADNRPHDSSILTDASRG